MNNGVRERCGGLEEPLIHVAVGWGDELRNGCGGGGVYNELVEGQGKLAISWLPRVDVTGV